MSSSNTPKSRKHGKEERDQGPSKKLKKDYIAINRSIETQLDQLAGTSTTGIRNAPRTVKIVEFAEARAFEINAMNEALERSRQAKNIKASQSLPSHLRRRAASHNVKRLPVRLREKAREEMEQNNTKPKPASRRKKRYPGTLTEEYTRRQATKRWLETHIWHTKRMKMIEIWGYRLAEHPSEKSIKASYRASSHLSIIHDASYFGWIKLTGEATALIFLLNSVTDPTSPSVGSERYLNGQRHYSNYLYAYAKYPTDLVAPIDLIWQPKLDDDVTRKILIWIHPSAFEEALQILNDAIEHLGLKKAITLENLQNEFLMFELTGPRSTALLQTVLNVCEELTQSEKHQFNAPRINLESNKAWKALRDLRTSASLPPGVVLGLTIHDPRLSFPNKVPPRSNAISDVSHQELIQILANWPNEVALSDIWDDGKRKCLKENKISDGDLNKRRSANLIPGQKLEPLPEDAKIPILLIQRGIIGLQNRQFPSEYPNGWNIVIPSGWGMSLWKSFIFAGAWVGGLRERHNHHFEAGLSCFPYDFPGTKAFHIHALSEKAKAEDSYRKHPPAKRPNYTKLQVPFPFETPFENLLGLSTAVPDEALQESEKPAVEQTWILQGDKNLELLRNPMTDSNQLHELHQKLTTHFIEKMILRVKTFNDDGFMINLSKALVRVRITLRPRGVVSSNAIIYKADKKSLNFWANKQLNSKKSQYNYSVGSEDESAEVNRIPPASDIIGYITTGQYSFHQGHGFAIGCCSLTMVHNLLQSHTVDRGAKGSNNFVLVRKTTSSCCKLATLDLLT
ncbi:hypothetical protein G9A89_012107 [Geosiphon pyriformis]|nr:hypothetical protein G9A89_012107 [Geosiphon pyriformis]